MRIFFDTEFIEDGRTIDLLSIGAVREDGREFYAEVAETDRSRASDWVRTHVLPQLTGPVTSRYPLAYEFQDFAGQDPEFWAYYASYDWVALCQLYGTMMTLPSTWPMHVLDLRQLELHTGKSLSVIPNLGEHNALEDARWNFRAWKYLTTTVDEAPHNCGVCPMCKPQA